MRAYRYNAMVQGKVWYTPQLPPLFKSELTCGDPRRPQDEFVRLVETFQTIHGLTVDGKLGPVTWSYMRGDPYPGKLPVFQGKTMWVWMAQHLGKDFGRAAARMARAGVRQILFKVADGTYTEPFVEHLNEVLSAFRSRNIEVIPWVFAWCYDSRSSLRREIDFHLRLIDRVGSPAFVINAEKGFKERYRERDGSLVEKPDCRFQAEIYVEQLRQAGVELYLSSYGNPTHHGSFAWAELGSGVDFLMPQTYWGVHWLPNGPRSKRKHRAKPEELVDLAAREYRERCQTDALILPSGGCYQSSKDKGKSWDSGMHNAPEITRFMDYLDNMQVPMTAFWLYLHPSYRSRSARVQPQQWKAISTF